MQVHRGCCILSVAVGVPWGGVGVGVDIPDGVKSIRCVVWKSVHTWSLSGRSSQVCLAVFLGQRPYLLRFIFILFFKKLMWGFPGGRVVKNPPANAGDTGSSPGPGRFPHAAEQLSPCATTTEPAL